MSINAVSSQSPTYAPTAPAASSPRAAFTLDAEAPARAVGVVALTPEQDAARQALWEKIRPEVEARDKAVKENFNRWIDSLKRPATQGDMPNGQVMKDGEVVATVYNSGAMSGSDLSMVPLDEPPGVTGPELARWRAEHIVRAVGGTFVGLDTAQTQEEWATELANRPERPPAMGFRAWSEANGLVEAFDTRAYMRDLRDVRA